MESTASLLAEQQLLLQDVRAEAAQAAAGINLNANENSLSATARSVLSTPLEGYYELSELEAIDESPVTMKGDLMYRNLPALRLLLKRGELALRRLLGAGYVDLRPLSGVHAMECTVLALSEPGQSVWSLSPENSGHFATRHIVERSGRRSAFLPWDSARFDLDFEALARVPGEPDLIFLDQSLCLYPLSLRRLRALYPRAIIVYDASHTLGLIMGKQWPDPFAEGADVVQGNTHKTFPGPQKALISARSSEIAARLRAALSGGLLSSQHTHHTAALAITALEMACFGPAYAATVVNNTRTFARLLASEGFRVMGPRAPEGHMIFAQPPAGLDAYELCLRLQTVGISCNARRIAGEPWLRFGTQEISRRGASGFVILRLVLAISAIARGEQPEQSAPLLAKIAAGLTKKHFSFDEAAEESYEAAVVPRSDAIVS